LWTTRSLFPENPVARLSPGQSGTGLGYATSLFCRRVIGGEFSKIDYHPSRAHGPVFNPPSAYRFRLEIGSEVRLFWVGCSVGGDFLRFVWFYSPPAFVRNTPSCGGLSPAEAFSYYLGVSSGRGPEGNHGFRFLLHKAIPLGWST